MVLNASSKYSHHNIIMYRKTKKNLTVFLYYYCFFIFYFRITWHLIRKFKCANRANGRAKLKLQNWLIIIQHTYPKVYSSAKKKKTKKNKQF